ILLYIDMDYFKFVNDTHGHQVGDAALVALAKLLSGDGKSRQGDIAGRQGGDEFAMWLEETDLEGGRHKADELLEIAARLRKYSGDAEHPLGISIGIAVADPAFDDDLDQLLNRADSALYEAKRGGRGRGQFWPNVAKTSILTYPMGPSKRRLRNAEDTVKPHNEAEKLRKPA
ncbi:MAG: GGDEF domain-containing protein, partial [Alphaproteobacteria bacterium]